MNLNDKTSSFGLARTNPKISGNVKITVDSTGLIWLNSIDATKELSASDFKKFRIGTAGSSYEADLKNCFGKLPPSIVFNAFENKPNPTNTSTTFEDQYDFFYNMGAQNLISKFYDEDYSYFAPLWLRDDLPEYFVIFKVDEPLDFPYNDNVASGDLVIGKKYIVKGDANFTIKYGTNDFFNNNQTFTPTILKGTTYTIISGTGKVVDLDENKDLPINTIEQFKSIVKRAHIIKTFDLGENTNIGKYIRNIVNGKLFPTSPISVRFDQGLMTTWNGASYQDGIMTSKGELLDDFWTKGQTQIDFEEYITKGFERHGIICPYLLNLEFLFNDTEAPIYSIPRYFGFYVSKIELAQMQLDGQALYTNRNISGNTPAPKRANRGFRQQSDVFFQNNDNGVRMYYENPTQFDPSIPLFIPSSDTFINNFESRFYWIQDRNGNFYSFDQTGNTTYNTNPNIKDIVIRNKSVDLGLFGGPGAVKLQDKGNKLADKGRSYMVIRINSELFPNDTIKLFWNLGNLVDSPDIGKYHVLTANDLSKRPFTVPAGGTVLTIVGMDLTSQYAAGESIQINYGVGKSTIKVLAAAPVYAFGNTTLTIASPIDLVTTSGTTPIVPGWGPKSALISDDNDTIYYHPYGTFNEIAQSIANAFNLIEDKTFDAVAIDDQVVIRMRQGESISNSFSVMAQLTLTNEMYFQGVQYAPLTKFFFEGGTDTNHIRLKFPFPDTDTLKDGEVFLKTKRGLSKIAFVGRYVDEAVNAVGSSEVGDLVGFREFGALYIEDNLDEPVTTTTGDFISYSLFNIPVGLFSIFNVKEIDGDFFSSSYARSPITEVHRYFDIFADTPRVLVPGRKYLVMSETLTDSISYLGSTITASLNGTVFTAGLIPGENSATGDGVNTTFTFNLLYPPVESGSLTIFAGVEIFNDNGNGTLTSNLSGTGTVDYETGVVSITSILPVPNFTPIISTYHSLSGFTVTSGNPIVVAQIFYAANVPPTKLPNPVKTLDPTHTYVVFGDTSEYVLDSFSNSIFATFNGSFVLTPGSTYYTLVVGNPLVIDIDKFSMDQDIKAFSGFWTFKDIVDVTDNTDTTTIEFTNREKFIHHDINSEYDYLKENFSKEESVKSRMFPSISKWVYQGGDDIRDNPYRLNTHPVFGPMNFSPSSVIKTQDPQGFSHEWPYLEQPPQQYPNGLLKDNYYFFYDRIDLNKIKDANPANVDYFTEYFTFQPAPDTPDQERYDIFRFNTEIGLCEAFFRGVKIRIKEVIKDTKIPQIQGIKPPFKDRSTRFEGYKFSVILRPLKQDPNSIQAPVTFNLIENKTHQTITFVIDLVIEDYRTLTLINPNDLGNYGSPVLPYPNLLDSHVDYLLLYSMKSKESEKLADDSASIFIRGLDGHDFGDIKLSVGINASSPSGLIGGFTVINVFDNPDYDWDLRDEFKNFDAENILTGSFIFGDTKFPYPLQVNQSKIFFGLTGNLYPQDPTTPYPNFEAPIANNIFIPYGSDFDWEGFPWTQVHGGKLYLEPIMQRIAFGRIAEKINLYSPFIKYTTYLWDATTETTKVSSNEFYIEVIDPSKITKTDAVLPQIDEDKPEEFKNESTIGVDFVNVNYFSEIYRHSGPYEPKFRNVLYFKDQKTDVITDANVKLSFMQATFNPAVDGFGFINNLGYLKVATHDVLTLANNPKYAPRYPLLNEVPVDKRDFFTFQSSWDPGFWRIYTTKKDFFPQAGTREMLEVKNFMGTKIMKTHDLIRLQDWTIEPQIASLDQINIDNFTGEIVYAIVNGKLQALINVKKRLLRFLIADGASTEFNKYLLSEFGTGDPDTLDDDVLEYLTLNVLPTYEVKLVDLYIRKYKENLNLPIIRGDLTDAQKLQNQYLLDKNFTSQKKSDFVYYFEYALDKSFNVSLAPSLNVGKI